MPCIVSCTPDSPLITMRLRVRPVFSRTSGHHGLYLLIGIIALAASCECFALWGTPKKSHFKTVTKATLDKVDSLEILYVMDPNGPYCFDEVPIDDFVKRQLLSWVRQLKDELTRSSIKPMGHDLRVRPMLKGEAHTFTPSIKIMVRYLCEIFLFL